MQGGASCISELLGDRGSCTFLTQKRFVISVAEAIFFLFFGLRILRLKFLQLEKKIKIFMTFFICSDVKNCEI